jgi:CubicO group peptidase (beta-lactamase class C family)
MKRNALRLIAWLLVCWGAEAHASQPAAPPVVEGPLAARLDACLDQHAHNGFSGSILVAQEGRVILSKGYGLADRSRKTPVTADTVFDICSLSKQFTAAAILKLEMQGQLQVTDPIDKFFAGVPPDKRRITLHHLLTHTAGLPNILGDDSPPNSREEMLREALASKLRFQPGQRWAYSNLGYSLLAAVVELRSGVSLERFLRDNVFEPAGLAETGFRLPDWPPDAIAHGYRRGADLGSPLAHHMAADGPYWNLRGNGGVLSTVGDLYRWHVALQDENVLSQAAKEKYFAPHMREDATDQRFYGYGWTMTTTNRGTKRIGHSGSDGIFRSDFAWYPDENVLLIITSNVAEQSCLSVERHLLPIIFEK